MLNTIKIYNNNAGNYNYFYTVNKFGNIISNILTKRFYTVFVSAILISCKNQSDQNTDPIELYLFNQWHNNNQKGAVSDCPVNIRDAAEITVAEPIGSIVKENDLCFYYINGDSTLKKIRLISLSGDSDLAVSYAGAYPGNDDYGFRRCAEEGWESCSVNSGFDWDEISVTTNAGLTRYIGVHGYYCPAGECQFKIELNNSGSLNRK
jgi:hypothetical protein